MNSTSSLPVRATHRWKKAKGRQWRFHAPSHVSTLVRSLLIVGMGAMAMGAMTILSRSLHAQSLADRVAAVEPKMVKIMGSGGFQGLEPYQSGFLISPDGYVLTVWSYVLDADGVTVTLGDGQRFEGKLVGYDPRIEIALLKIDAKGLNCFHLDAARQPEIGDRVLAFSNLYGVATGNEPVSVQRGIVASLAPLKARRGAFASSYQGPAILLDTITNNPGAAGGAVTNIRGELLGVIGKELKDQRTGDWINFAIPITSLADSVHAIQSGKMIVQSESPTQRPAEPITMRLLGCRFVPAVVSKTPPYIDRVASGSVAQRCGLRPDDLVIEINGHLTPNISQALQQLSQIDRDEAFEMTVQRNHRFVTLNIQPVP